MFHVWINSFFVNPSVKFSEDCNNTSLSVVGHMHTTNSIGTNHTQSKTLYIQIAKAEIDIANKDTTHKIFSSDFKVRTCSAITQHGQGLRPLFLICN
jgi:hypothetical protein